MVRKKDTTGQDRSAAATQANANAKQNRPTQSQRWGPSEEGLSTQPVKCPCSVTWSALPRHRVRGTQPLCSTSLPRVWDSACLRAESADAPLILTQCGAGYHRVFPGPGAWGDGMTRRAVAACAASARQGGSEWGRNTSALVRPTPNGRECQWGSSS